MGRHGIVRASAVARHGRWDARYFLGDVALLELRVGQAREGVARARDGLAYALRALRAERRRLAALEAEGAVRRSP